MTTHDFVVHRYPESKGWMILVDGRLIPLVFETEADAVEMVLYLHQTYPDDGKAAPAAPDGQLVLQAH